MKENKVLKQIKGSINSNNSNKSNNSNISNANFPDINNNNNTNSNNRPMATKYNTNQNPTTNTNNTNNTNNNNNYLKTEVDTDCITTIEVDGAKIKPGSKTKMKEIKGNSNNFNNKNTSNKFNNNNYNNTNDNDKQTKSSPRVKYRPKTTQYNTTKTDTDTDYLDTEISTKKVRNIIMPSKISSIGFLEIFNHPKLKELKEKIDKMPVKQRENHKYDNKIQLPIVESLIFESGQPSYWLFTDINGYVMKRSSKKLNKDYIIYYFQKSLIDFCLAHKEFTYPTSSEKKLIDDISKYCILLEQKYENNLLMDELKYLDNIVNKKFILISGAGEEKLHNVIELNRYLSDVNKVSSINLIQNFININIGCKPILCKYSKKDILSPKLYVVFTVKPMNISSETADEYDLKKIWTTKLKQQNTYRIGSSEPDPEKEREKDFLQDVIKLYDQNLTLQVENISNEFIRFYEKLEKVDIFYFLLNFYKTVEGRLVFSGAEKIMLRPKLPEKIDIEKSDKHYLETETKKHFEGLNKKVECFGDFCNYEIPK